MVNLLNPELRTRDLRKLVEPHLYEVNWEPGVDNSSEWVLASLEDEDHVARLAAWLQSKNVLDNFKALVTDKSWSEVSEIRWTQLLRNPEQFFSGKHLLIVAADRSWVVECVPLGVARFGRWV